MQRPINKERLRLYGRIGIAYTLLWMISELIQHPDALPTTVLSGCWRSVYIVGVNYLFFEYTLPGLTRKRILRSLFRLGVQLFLFSFGFYAWRAFGIQLHVYTVAKTYPSTGEAVAAQFSASVFSVFFFGLIRHLYDHLQLKQAAQQLRIEKQAAELNYLKAQTNPHFLFNTLNNLYSLAKDKSDLAPEAILRLSQLLRFMLYETSSDYIAIDQELKIMNDYIALEKLRYDESLRVKFNHDLEDPKQAIPPLLLIPLVENAFKHGVSETRTQPFVDIHLSVKQRQLTFLVKNSTETFSDEAGKENIGLSNLRRQLQLLYTEYSLAVQPGESQFTATLKINLASHV